MMGIESAGGEVENGAAENGDDESAKDGSNEWIATVFDKVDNVATGEKGNNSDRH